MPPDALLRDTYRSQINALGYTESSIPNPLNSTAVNHACPISKHQTAIASRTENRTTVPNLECGEASGQLFPTSQIPTVKK
jgi:hypothetical protein